MIKVNDKWGIEVDAYNYSIYRFKDDVVAKDGKVNHRYLGHYSSLDAAMRGMLDFDVRDKLSEGDFQIGEALDKYKKEVQKFEELLKLKIGGMPNE